MHTWHAVDLRSGERGPQLQMQTRGTVSRIIGEATDTQGAVLCWDQRTGAAVPEWRQWTQPGRMMAVLVDDDDTPLWGGTIVRRIPDATVWVPLTMTTLESYLDRRYAGDKTFAAVDQANIAAELVQATIVSSGIPFMIDAQLTGQLRDRTYLDSEDKTVLSLLTDLMNLQNGLEFTVDLEWANASHTTLNRIVRLRSRLGRSVSAPVRFEHPGPVTSFNIPEDYTKDNGANDVLATSTGTGTGTDPRPQARAVDQGSLDAGWVRYERRFTPSTSITDTATLDSYAASELTRTKAGLAQISLVANLDTCPRLNSDWWLGDDITAAITAPAFPERDYPKRPGYERTVRAVGWSIDLDARTLTPTVQEY